MVTPGTGPTDAPTWHKDVAPIVVESCSGCHTDGGLGGFSLDDPEMARSMASAMATAVENRTMPPWGAYETDDCEPELAFKGDMRLSDEEIATIRAWADAGAPEGDPETAAELVAPLTWSLEGDDLQDVFPEFAYTAAGLDDQFICFTLDLGLEEGRWLNGLEILPGNVEVVHHSLVFADTEAQGASLADERGQYECFGSARVDGALVGAWAPGALPNTTPPGSGTWMPAGTRLAMQIHYHPNGAEAEPDLTGVRLSWATEEPDHEAEIILLGNASSRREGLEPGEGDSSDRPEFLIPAGEAAHQERMYFDLPAYADGIQVYMAGTHMHYLGADMRVSVDRADGSGNECFIRTPLYDFEWQRSYDYEGTYADYPTLHGGDRLWMECTYNNTLDHPGTRAALEDAGLNAPIDVSLGEETLDEMCLAVLGIVYPR